MQIRWAPKAADALEAIADHLSQDSPAEVQRVDREIYGRIGSLLRTFRTPDGTRELPLPPLPFIVVYRLVEHLDAVEGDAVEIVSQRWPPAG